jgi:DNA-binding SARP family transcriptional activator
MCDKLAELNLEMGNYQDATKWASAILKVDRCDEETHRQLIRAHAAQGRRNEALRQYQYCQRVLNEELGIQPASETQKLFHMLLKGEDCSISENAKRR